MCVGLPRLVRGPAASYSMTGSKTVTVATGQQERIPLRFELPATLAPGRYELQRERQIQQRRDPDRRLLHRRPAAARGRARTEREDCLVRPQRRNRRAAEQAGSSESVRRGRRRSVRVRHSHRRQGRADGRRAGAGHQPRARWPEGDRVRADRGGPGEAARVPRGGIRLAAGLPARAGSSASGRTRRRAPARLARRGDDPSAAAEVRDAAALRADRPVVRHPGHAAVALRQPRQRGLRPDREARARRFPADPRRRLQPSSTARCWSTAKARAWCSSARWT